MDWISVINALMPLAFLFIGLILGRYSKIISVTRPHDRDE